jgi:hypothetical protein
MNLTQAPPHFKTNVILQMGGNWPTVRLLSTYENMRRSPELDLDPRSRDSFSCAVLRYTDV